MDEERLKKQFEFIAEIDKEKEIMRQSYLTDGSRKEDDAEHAWHLAMMVMILSEYSNEEIDKMRTMSMCLIHDLVEVYAGDTFAYDEAGNATKRDREVRAADRLFGILPADQCSYVRGLWDEFEAAETPEARFAHTLDRLQPLMLGHLSGGKNWAEHGVCAEQIYKRNEYTSKGSKILWEYAEENFIKPNIGKAVKE